MAKKGGGTSAPDPYATAAAQSTANDQAARLNATLNRGNTVTPYGTVTNTAANANWNEAGYLAANPDVAAEVRAGTTKSGLDHYTMFGQQENRPGVAEGFVPGQADQWTTTVQLSPEQQRIYDLDTYTTKTTSEAAAESANRLSSLLGTKFDTSGLQALNGSVAAPTLQSGIADPTAALRSDFNTGATMSKLGDEDYEESRKRVEQSLLDRLQPQQQRDQQSQDARLAAQGISLGSQAYDAAERNRLSGVNDARLAAVMAGGQEQSRLFGMDLSRMQANNGASQAETQNWNSALQSMNAARAQQFGENETRTAQANDAAQNNFSMQLQSANQGNQTRAQQLAEALQLRAQPINEVAALFGLGNGVQVPTAASLSPTATQSGDIAGGVNSAYQTKLQQAGASNQALASGLGSAASLATMLLSDRRAKTDIRRIGQLDNGLPVYAFRYKTGGPMQVGLMAQDVELVRPHAVAEVDGFKMVDYAEATV